MPDGILSLYPLFTTVDGSFLFRPVFPVTPYPIYISLDQIRDFVGGFPAYILVTPTNGQTLNIPLIDKFIMNPAGVLSTLTLNLPIAMDKRSIRIATRQRIDNLTITSSGGAAVDWITTTLPQNGTVDFTYVESIAAWVRA